MEAGLPQLSYGDKEITFEKFQGRPQDPQGHEGAERRQAQVRERPKGEEPEAGDCDCTERGSRGRGKNSEEEGYKEAGD